MQKYNHIDLNDEDTCNNITVQITVRKIIIHKSDFMKNGKI